MVGLPDPSWTRTPVLWRMVSDCLAFTLHLLMLLPWHLRSAPPGPQPHPLMILGTAHVFLDGLHMMPRRWYTVTMVWTYGHGGGFAAVKHPCSDKKELWLCTLLWAESTNMSVGSTTCRNNNQTSAAQHGCSNTILTMFLPMFQSFLNSDILTSTTAN